MQKEEGAGCMCVRPGIWERDGGPDTGRSGEACWAEGIVTLFHLDTSWDKKLPYYKELPRGSAILELDGNTDIIAAKELLRGHLCLKGDVPAALLSIGKVEEVEAYCRKLIDQVGSDGGFILSSGCSVPANVRPENFRALIDTGKRHAPS